MVRLLYRVVTWIVLPLVFAYFYWRGRHEPDYRQRWSERLGWGAAVSGRPLWIHAASVGEVGLAEPLIKALRDRYPHRPIIVTTFTPTGSARAQARLGDSVCHRYLPLDTVGATRRFISRVKPCCGIVIETEIWPNLLAAAARAKVPMLLANASISERSAKRYDNRLLAVLMRFAVADLTAIGAASAVHAQRFVALGVPQDRIHVTGNLKYDVAPQADTAEQGAVLRHAWQARQRPVWVAASTHEGEEAVLLAAHRKLLTWHDNALLIIAPRHPQRFAAVDELLMQQGWHYANHARDADVDGATQVLFGNTLGDVPRFYAAADVAFVGGSLVPGIGGHNVLEAALLTRPLMFGPHVEEWQDICSALIKANAAVTVDSADAIATQLTQWFDTPVAAAKAGQSALSAAQARQGALTRTIALLDQVIPGVR